ncbi:MAG: microviridin/marinostatin family tricyclic proteinase inhibitor, partial [Pyrinomonadaceae bacterium]
MKGRKQKGQSVPPPDADTTTPFFARFLEDQHGDAEAKAPAEFMTLKYPSDRDEIDIYSPTHADAAPAEAAPSRMTLKYPSDRDEIDLYNV